MHTTTNAGLHEFVATHALSRYARPGLRAVDLGSGPGTMAARLHSLGCEVLAVDRDAKDFVAGLRHVSLDFNQPDLAAALESGSFGLVTAIEVIESPIAFLRNVTRLLAPGGVAILTTPNVDSLPARLKFLLAGKIRTMEEHGEPTHISPIFMDLLRRQYFIRAGLRLREHFVFPPHGYRLTRRPIAWAIRLGAPLFPGDALLGDNHIFVLEPGP